MGELKCTVRDPKNLSRPHGPVGTGPFPHKILIQPQILRRTTSLGKFKDQKKSRPERRVEAHRGAQADKYTFRPHRTGRLVAPTLCHIMGRA